MTRYWSGFGARIRHLGAEQRIIQPQIRLHDRDCRQLRPAGLDGLLHPLGVKPFVAIEHRAKRLFNDHFTAARCQMQDPHVFGIGALAQAAAQSVIGAAKHQAWE